MVFRFLFVLELRGSGLLHHVEPLSDGSFHLHFNQLVQLQCIFHWELFRDWLNKATNNHGHSFVFCDAAGLKIKKLLGAYLRNFRHAWYRQLTPAEMAALAARQIDLLFDGAAPRP